VKNLQRSAFGLLCLLVLASCSWVKGLFNPEVVHEPVEKVATETLRISRDALENVKQVRAQATDFPKLLSLMGKISITEDRMTIIPSRVTGRIETIHFASGEKVSAGQVLATLFSPDYISAREEYLQSLKQQESSASKGIESTSSDFANLAQMSRKKLETMGLSKDDISQLATENQAANSRPLLVVRAARSGVLIQKNAVLGNLVNTGDTLFMIGDLSKVWFSGDIFPEDLEKVHKDQEVYINAVGVDKPLSGKVSFISPLVDPNTRSIKIRVLMDNPKEALKADEYVQGNVVLSRASAVVVPTPAVIRVADDTFVFKRITPRSVEEKPAFLDFQRVKVTIGTEQSGLIAVTSGLADGDEVIGEGSLLLDAALNTANSRDTDKK